MAKRIHTVTEKKTQSNVIRTPNPKERDMDHLVILEKKRGPHPDRKKQKRKDHCRKPIKNKD